MKRLLTLLGIGAVAPMLQGALVPYLPGGVCPDLPLLFVITLGLSWRSALGGRAIAAGTGFVTDLLSGSLLGQHALLYVVAHAAARLASRHINLRGVGPQVIFCAAWSAIHGAAMAGLTAFFSPQIGFGWIDAGDLLVRSGVTAVAAPAVFALVSTVVRWLDDDDGGRRLRGFEPRKFSA